ncbi:MAG: beta-N-acetylhexosaminidase [Pyrinomonadaceae bacterium]
MKLRLASFLLFLFGASAFAAPTPTELFMRGYTVIPTPQRVRLEPGDVELDDSWAYEAKGMDEQQIAVRALLTDLKDFHGFVLRPKNQRSGGLIRLAIDPNAVATTTSDQEIKRQGYALKIAPGLIEITGNSEQGLFYGVASVLQLLRKSERGRLTLPVGVIEDWPKLQLRFLHWDTKHHQDKIETLKRYLDWAARFKINMIGFELEDKFAYPSHPIIGAPGAFTPAQLQEIVDYALERYIQVVPQVQAPAHLAYVLKYPQFAHLKSDDNNYQACLCDEETYRVVFAMYDDLIRATKGIDYFFVSTDEVYYAGVCAKCGAPSNPTAQSLKWLEFVERAHRFMSERKRRMLIWAEYPLLPEHVERLPADIIDGIVGSEDYLPAEKARGIRQLAYTALQGEELLFPNYMNWESARGLAVGSLAEAQRALTAGRALRGNPIGAFGAAWDDAGLHNETFWLGWATAAQFAWASGTPSLEQTIAEFMEIFYGRRVANMPDVYRELQKQARFFERSWDRVVSRERGAGYGNSFGKGIGTTRYDRTLPRPALPSLPNLYFTPIYTGKYGVLAEEAAQMAQDNEALRQKIHENILKAERNHYNLEVFLSLGELIGHHNRLIVGMKSIEDDFAAAQEAAAKNDQKQAIEQIIAAYDKARELVAGRRETFALLQTVWEKSRFPKGQEVDGKKFTHVLDDTKDHWADRRADLSYMIAPEESIGLEEWMKQLAAVIREYAQAKNIPIRNFNESQPQG